MPRTTRSSSRKKPEETPEPDPQPKPEEQLAEPEPQPILPQATEELIEAIDEQVERVMEAAQDSVQEPEEQRIPLIHVKGMPERFKDEQWDKDMYHEHLINKMKEEGEEFFDLTTPSGAPKLLYIPKEEPVLAEDVPQLQVPVPSIDELQEHFSIIKDTDLIGVIVWTAMITVGIDRVLRKFGF